jgi:hypothetical protein
MKYLPLVMTRGKLLAQVVREASQDPRCHTLCGCCGARMPIKPDRSDQMVRCPVCYRRQQVTAREEVPWRLTATSAEALRRTARWVRRL